MCRIRTVFTYGYHIYTRGTNFVTYISARGAQIKFAVICRTSTDDDRNFLHRENSMIKRKLTRLAAALLSVAMLFCAGGELFTPAIAVTALEEKSERLRLIPGGMPFGVRIYCEGVLIVGITDVKSSGKSCSPASDAGIKANDVIISIDQNKVSSVDDVVNAISNCNGNKLSLKIKRQNDELTLDIHPVKSDEDGKYKTGLWMRDSTAGIGTVTFITPGTNSFAGLGHGICDADTGELLPFGRGTVVNVEISGIEKGQAGVPGELKGFFSSGKIGSLTGNTECGVYGVLAELPSGAGGEAIEAARADEVVEGDAEILCTIDGQGIGRYKIRISNIDHSGREIKNFVVTIVDERLLEQTGGIVQGMCVCYNRDNTGNSDFIRVFGALPDFIDTQSEMNSKCAPALVLS